MSLEKAQHTPNAHTTTGQSPDTTVAKQIILTRRSPAYWRVTFDHPPLNIFGPETIPQLNEIITALEIDEQVKVVVFDSAVDGFFLTHYNFLAKLEDSTRLPAGRTGLQALPDMLVRLSRCPVASIASIRGSATGVGSELALASDMRFASREKAILSQWDYMQDYGGPVGFRMALAHPDRVEALIIQDAVAHNEGLGANWKTRRAFWANRAAKRKHASHKYPVAGDDPDAPYRERSQRRTL
jgi:hypothetical protein